MEHDVARDKTGGYDVVAAVGGDVHSVGGQYKVVGSGHRMVEGRDGPAHPLVWVTGSKLRGGRRIPRRHHYNCKRLEQKEEQEEEEEQQQQQQKCTRVTRVSLHECVNQLSGQNQRKPEFLRLITAILQLSNN